MFAEHRNYIIEPELLSVESHTFEKPFKDHRKQIHPVVYCLNLAMMLSIPLFVVFQIFYEAKRLDIKGKVGVGFIFWCTTVMLVTIVNLQIAFKNVLKTLIILDSLLVSFMVGCLVFVGLMYFLDHGEWEYKILQLAFCIGAFSKILNIRLLLLYLKWKRIQVIGFKLTLFIMALIYFGVGVFCTYTNYSFTYSLFKELDQRIQYFVVLFTFAAFDFMTSMIKVFCAFDYSEHFRSDYVIKDLDQENESTREEILNSYARALQLGKESVKKESVHMIPVKKLPPYKSKTSRAIQKKQSIKKRMTERSFIRHDE